MARNGRAYRPRRRGRGGRERVRRASHPRRISQPCWSWGISPALRVPVVPSRAGLLLLIWLGPGKRVVDDADGIAVVAFQPSADVAQPRHVHARGEDAEVKQAGIVQHKHEIAWNGWRLKPAYGYVVSAF